MTALTAALLLAACAVPATTPAGAPSPAPVVTGTASYHERIALPPGAILQIVLEDASRPGTTAVTLARSTLDAHPGPPYRFALAYDPARVDPAGSYTVRAFLTVGDERWFMSDRAYPVITQGHPSELAVTLVNSGRVPDLVLPGSYAGALVCPGCADANVHLDLWTDGAFHLRREPLAGGAPRDDLGRWRFHAARRALVLRLADGESLHLEVLHVGALRVLGGDGLPLPVGSQDTLRGAGRLTATDLDLALAGELRIGDDSVTLLACASGRRYLVEGDHDARGTEAAYLALAPSPGAPLFVTLDARVAASQAGGGEPAMVVRRLIGAWPDLDCERDGESASLRSTSWHPVRIGDDPVVIPGDPRDPYLFLEPDSARFRTTLGCNAISGGFEAGAEALRFSAAASTLRACPPPLDALERAWTDVLERTRGYRIVAATLELFDADGASLALLLASGRR